MPSTYRRIVLASRPKGPVTPDNFRFESEPVPTPGAGQVLVRNHYLSLDPYMRGRMDEAKSYVPPTKLDETMPGGTVGVVEASNDPKLAVGDTVLTQLGWQEYGVADARQLVKVDTAAVPMSAYLGAVGMPGVTAWYGLNRICEPKAGETVLVSAASGAVGSVVGQLAKMAGCRAIGIAGGRDKCDYVVSELGFDACIDHREHADWKSLAKALQQAAPNGIDGLFENVAGKCLDAALACMNPFGRIALCGLIAAFGGQDVAMYNVRFLLTMRLKLRGFIVAEHMEDWPKALAELGRGVATGKIKFRESVAQGLDAAPEAFIGMLAGRNFGKQLVKLV
jgi:NADPH-dependent curcumin reductase CurA